MDNNTVVLVSVQLCQKLTMQLCRSAWSTMLNRATAFKGLNGIRVTRERRRERNPVFFHEMNDYTSYDKRQLINCCYDTKTIKR